MVEWDKAIQEYVKFPADDLEIEGVMQRPKGEGPFPAVAVCHPHPLYGGNMNNNVVLAVCNSLAQISVAALRFNFRGVGHSQGSYEDGIGEQEDVIGALAYLEKAAGIDNNRIGLVGYSFGSMVSFPVAIGNDTIKALALISPFLADQEWEKMKGSQIPGLFLCGDADGFISAQVVKQHVASLGGNNQYVIIPGADHFWWGYEGEIADKILAFFKDNI